MNDEGVEDGEGRHGGDVDGGGESDGEGDDGFGMMAVRGSGGAIRPIVPIMVSANGCSVPTYAMLDSGASGVVVVPSIVRQLGVVPKKEMRTIATLDQRNLWETNLVNFDVSLFETDICIHIKEAMMCNILKTSNDRPPSNKDVEDVEQMEDVVSFHELDDESIGV
jgi:hypothetical protein